jgi:hypothetical protein
LDIRLRLLPQPEPRSKIRDLNVAIDRRVRSWAEDIAVQLNAAVIALTARLMHVATISSLLQGRDVVCVWSGGSLSKSEISVSQQAWRQVVWESIETSALP